MCTENGPVAAEQKTKINFDFLSRARKKKEVDECSSN